MKIAIVGTGYVGLVTGTCFAESGNTVTCVDIDAAKVEKLRKGIIPIYEPGLELLFKRNVKQERLQFTTELKEGVADAQVIFLCLPTPPSHDDSADLCHLLSVAEELGPMLTAYTVVVDKSTAPVGTSEKVKERIQAGARVEVDVVVNPEFLREGIAVEDFMKPDRIVIGTESDRAKKIMKMLYYTFIRQGSPLIFMDERSAELTKYAANSFLATKISFMNEIANLSELFGCNVDSVRKGLGSDSRIGKRFLFSGIGYGGSCFPKDVKALAKSSSMVGYNFRILNAVMEVNQTQRLKLIESLKEHFNGNLAGKTIAMWGLSFKPHTDDIREASSIYNILALLDEGAYVKVHDPEAMSNTKAILGDKVQYCNTPYEAADRADALMIMTEWPEFRTPDFKMLASGLVNKLIFDGRNIFDLNTMREAGFTYYSIGRETIQGASDGRLISIETAVQSGELKMAANE